MKLAHSPNDYFWFALFWQALEEEYIVDDNAEGDADSGDLTTETNEDYKDGSVVEESDIERVELDLDSIIRIIKN